MVIEVIIDDPNLSAQNEVKAEPDIDVNGKKLRMAQGMDGKWYGYFAEKTMAILADETLRTDNKGTFEETEGRGLDFGGFCSSTTSDTDIIGTTGGFSETVGFSIAKNFIQDVGKKYEGILQTSPTQGTDSFADCIFINSDDSSSEESEDWSFYPTPVANHVVRNAPELNNSPGIKIGQIGLIEDTWPIIQLYDFTDNSEVVIIYNRGGNNEFVMLHFDELEEYTSIEFDATAFPPGAELHLTLHDNQLNIDPTEYDSWTFDTDESSLKVIYQMYDESGNNDGQGNGDTEVDIFSELSTLGFGANGFLVIIPNTQSGDSNVVENDQSSLIVGSEPTKPLSFAVTLVETGPNSGIFGSYDWNGNSNIDISFDAKRDTSAIIEYGKNKYSILVRNFDATLKLSHQ